MIKDTGKALAKDRDETRTVMSLSLKIPQRDQKQIPSYK